MLEKATELILTIEEWRQRILRRFVIDYHAYKLLTKEDLFSNFVNHSDENTEKALCRLIKDQFIIEIEKDVKIDIVAGTSIGGVNAAIIAGSKNEKQPEQLLEQFWLELADSFIDLDNIRLSSLSPYLEQLTANHYYFSPSTSQQNKIESKRKMEEYRNRYIRSFFSSGMFGNDKMFKARWRPEYALTDPEYFEPAKWHDVTASLLSLNYFGRREDNILQNAQKLSIRLM